MEVNYRLEDSALVLLKYDQYKFQHILVKKVLIY